MNKGLEYILNKQEIISTVSRQDLIVRPHEVRSTYQRHAYTHIPLGDTADLERRMLSRVNSGKPALGAIVAPYGYGKTSTIAFLWYRSEENGYIATPPFMMSSLTDVLDSVYGWTRFRLSEQSKDLASKLDLIYRDYTESEVEDRARVYAERHGISVAAAKGIMQDQLRNDELVLELTPSKLLRFIEQISDLVTEADYKGLILLPDEIQQYISNSRSQQNVIQNLREFIWGFRVKQGKIGMLISMPTYTEAGIQEAGNDILDRLRDHGLYHNLLNVYSEDFPAKLWKRYVEELEIGEYADRIFDYGTLKAIGQISSREDLGRGPRTVISLFKLAIVHFRDYKEAFTPEHVIEAFLKGYVAFEDAESKLRIAVNNALSASVVNTEDKRKAIKLLAAFPNTGCSDEIQRRYKVEKAVEQLSDKAHAILISYQIDGYTLLELLPRESKEEGIIDRLITKFWRTYDEDALRAKFAQSAFIKYIILDRIFVTKRGLTLLSWSEEENIRLGPSGCQEGILNGSFTSEYPKRRLQLRIATNEEQLSSLSDSKSDLIFDFLLNLDRGLEDLGQILSISENHLRFDLNILLRFSGNLPSDIKRLQEFVNPKRVTPLLMLSLINFIDMSISEDSSEITRTEEGQIEMFRNNLINHSINRVLNEDLANTFGPDTKPIQMGERLVSQVFTQKCKELWPDHFTFMVQPAYKGVIDNYIKALNTLSPKQRRGNETIEETKRDIAVRFGYQSVATFENKVESDYKHLVKRERWSGRGDDSRASICLVLHPLEQSLLKRLESSERVCEIESGKEVPALNHEEIYNVGAPLGYRTEEIGFALQLLAARGYIRRVKDLVVLAFETRPKSEIIKDIQIFKQKADLVGSLLKSSDDPKQLSDDLSQKLQLTDRSDVDDDTLNQIDHVCKQMYPERLKELIRAYGLQIKGELVESDAEIRNMRADLFRNPFDEEIQGNLAFVMHLNELRVVLLDTLDGLKSDLDRAQRTHNRICNNAESLDLGSDLNQIADDLGDLSGSLDELSKNRDLILHKRDVFEKWKALNSKASALYNKLSGAHQLPELVRLRSRLTKELVPEIQEHFNQKRQDALEDYEIFGDRLSTLESNHDEIVSGIQSSFAQLRGEYEELLRDSLGISRSALHANCNVSNLQESYSSLHQQVREKVEDRADELNARIHEIHAKLLKITDILEVPKNQEEKVSQIKEDYSSIESLGDDLSNTLKLDTIADPDQFRDKCNSLKKQILKAGDLGKQLDEELMLPLPVSEDENDLLKKINPSRPAELSEIIVEVLKDRPDTPTARILEYLNGLYRKNRVKITVSRIN